MIVLGTYYLDEDSVKSIAYSMRAETGWQGIIVGAIASCVGGPYGVVSSIVGALAANSSARTEVEYAADNDMRVRVTVEDAEVHTSYSTVVLFKAVD